MKAIKDLSRFVAIGLLMTALALNFTACVEESPLAPSNELSPVSLSKRAERGHKGRGKGKGHTGDPGCNLRESGSLTLVWDDELNGYKGGNIQLGNGSKFHVDNAAFIPPEGTGRRADVTITMRAEKTDDNELIFTFGPSGSTFDPPAKIWLNWKTLGGKRPELFLIDSNENYIKQRPDDVDKKGKNYILYVHHFSRYALAWSQ